MAYKYSYGKCASLFKNPADVAGEVCQRLAESESGLTAKSLVDASRAEEAPLHNEFEWDNAIAGEKYREEQASSIIRHLIIVREEREAPKKDRSFVHTGFKNGGYVPLKDALTNEVWRENLLKAAYRDMESFVAKYHRLEELSGIIIRMKDLLDGNDKPA